MKRSFFTLLILAFSAVSAMAQCPTPSTVNASVTFKRPVPGLLSGNFSVSSSKKVSFSQGNLQYNSNTQRWQFASKQYTYIGNTTGNTSITADGKNNNTGVADLFGWIGASSTWTNDLKIHGLTSSITTNATDGSGNVATESLKSDWGNTMGDGWRTLTRAEWDYLLGTRTGTKASTLGAYADARFILATVNSVCGIIIFPDGGSFIASEFTSLTAANLNGTTAAYTSATCTASQWDALETKGCVFLPAAGNAVGTGVENAGTRGYYWSSTPNSGNAGQAITGPYFGDKDLSTSRVFFRSKRSSVRLVYDVE